jgi:hypothetical protein
MHRDGIGIHAGESVFDTGPAEVARIPSLFRLVSGVRLIGVEPAPSLKATSGCRLREVPPSNEALFASDSVREVSAQLKIGELRILMRTMHS